MNEYTKYFEEKIKGLKDILFKEYNISIDINELYVYIKDIEYDKDIIKIKKESIKDKDNFLNIFNGLCKEGKSWVHFSPIGFINNDYLIYEYNYSSNNIGYNFPFINWSVGFGLKIVIE